MIAQLAAALALAGAPAATGSAWKYSAAQPDAAAKLTGKMAGTNIAFLSALDGRAYSLDHAQPLFNILRALRGREQQHVPLQAMNR